MAPTLTASFPLASSAKDTSTLTTSAFTPGVSDVIVVKGASEDHLCVGGTPTATGLTFTLRASSAAANNAWVGVWTAVVASSSSITVSSSWSGNAGFHSATVERWTSAQLAATPATNATKTGTGAPSTTITTVAANSVVSWANADWAAVAPGTPAYRSSATQEQLDDHSTADYVAYHAWQSAAAAGSQTLGLTAPTGQTWTLIGVEVQASTTAPALAPPPISQYSGFH